MYRTNKIAVPIGSCFSHLHYSLSTHSFWKLNNNIYETSLKNVNKPYKSCNISKKLYVRYNIYIYTYIFTSVLHKVLSLIKIMLLSVFEQKTYAEHLTEYTLVKYFLRHSIGNSILYT